MTGDQLNSMASSEGKLHITTGYSQGILMQARYRCKQALLATTRRQTKATQLAGTQTSPHQVLGQWVLCVVPYAKMTMMNP